MPRRPDTHQGGELVRHAVESRSGCVFKTVGGLNRALWNLGETMPQSFLPLAAGVTRDRLDLLRECDHLVMEGLRRHGVYEDVWQCPTVLVPLEIDGQGEEFCIVRPILSERAMTATAAELPHDLLDELRRDILALPGISGLAYDLTSKPPGTIEWE
jgi:GMP synthase (glutamine-hydrolysing)